MNEWRPFSPPEKPVEPNSIPKGLPAPEREKKGAFATLAATVGLFLLKFKSLLFALKALPFLKFFFSGLTMLASMWAMAFRYGWRFGVGLVFLILIHELGHGAVMKKYGLRVGLPIFIPFFGAMIASRDPAPSRDAQADIAFGGPFWGSIFSMLVIAGFYLTRDPFFLMLGSTGLMLNMFNMIPVGMLDGGAIADMFSRTAWILGGIMLLGLFLMSPGSPVLILLLLGIPRMLSRPREELAPLELRRKWMARYFGLLAFMGAGIYFSQKLISMRGF